MSEFLQSILEQRSRRFMPYRGTGVRTPEEALEFFNEAGFCLFSHIPGMELPCLSNAVRQDEPVDTWEWKDSIPASREVYYGAIYYPAGWAARPGFVSLAMLAPLYSLAPILQFGGDRQTLRRYVKIGQEAIRITDALEREGPLSTGELRASTGLTGKINASKFSRALAEAQTHFLITKIGVTSTTRANYGYIWNTFERVFPQPAQQAETLTEIDATAAIIHQYVRTAVAVPLARIAEMLSLDPRSLALAARQLVEQGDLCEVKDDSVVYLAVKDQLS